MSHKESDVAKSSTTNPIIYAAGGLLWRQTSQGRRVALIFRGRYKDWTLPKGKITEKDRNWECAAKREVKEETGFDVEINGFAGCVSYEHDGKLKVVLFWHMTASGESDFKPSEEVKRYEWLPVQQAIRRLTYPREKELLRRNAKDCVTPASWWQRWRNRRSRRQRRLAASITTFREVLECRMEMMRDKDSVIEPPWASTAFRLLEMSDETLYKGEKSVDEGWHHFFEAHRMGLNGLNEGELEAVAKSLQAEVEKKLSSSWRGKAALSLLFQNPKDEKPLPVANINQAMELRDEDSSNRYLRLNLVLEQMKALAVYLLAILVAIYLLIRFWFGATLPLERLPESGSLRSLLLIFLFGMFGGALSTSLTLARSPSRSPIPEQFLEKWITFLRPLLGGAAAMVMYIVFISLNANLLEFKGNQGAVIFALAIAAGFSERMVLAAMEKVSTKG